MEISQETGWLSAGMRSEQTETIACIHTLAYDTAHALHQLVSISPSRRFVSAYSVIFSGKRSTIFLGPSPSHLHNEAESLEELQDEFDGNLPVHLPPLDWGANVPVEAGLQL